MSSTIKSKLFGEMAKSVYLCIVIMWWPARAPAPLLAEKGTQVRILGRTRCCIFPHMLLAEFPKFFGHCQKPGGKAPRQTTGMSQKTCHVVVKKIRALVELGQEHIADFLCAIPIFKVKPRCIS